MVKNENDIIEQTIKAAAKWSDFIYVYDNGSTDGSWETILKLSKELQVIPYKQDDRTYHNGLRREVFQHFLNNSSEGDWWCQLDADEIYIDDPRLFLAKVPNEYQTVWAASFRYYFTDRDWKKFQQDPAAYADNVPIEEKCRYYQTDWSEARFFKYDKDLIWAENRRWPYTGAVYPTRIWLKHYQDRSPQQMQDRIKIRLQARAEGSPSFRHEAEFENSHDLSQSHLKLTGDEWKTKIVQASELDFDAGDNKYIVRENLMPKIPSFSLVPPTFINKVRRIKKYVNRDNVTQMLRTIKS